MSLTASERLNRWGAAKKSPGDALKPSIASMRRMGEAEFTPVQPAPADAVARTLESDGVPVSMPAPFQAHVAVPPAENVSNDLAKSFAAMQAKLDTISNSVEFTEAYVSAGITRNIGEMLAKELAMAERLGAMRAQHQGRQRVLLLIVAALAALLVAEVQLDFLGAFTSEALVAGSGIFRAAVDGAIWAVSGLRSLI